MEKIETLCIKYQEIRTLHDLTLTELTYMYDVSLFFNS